MNRYSNGQGHQERCEPNNTQQEFSQYTEAFLRILLNLGPSWGYKKEGDETGVFNRTPDRRTGSRSSSLGRRKRKRYVLTSDLSAEIRRADKTSVMANVLDISLSGAYLVASSSRWTPQRGEQVLVALADDEGDIGSPISAKLEYVNIGSLLGDEVFGLGVSFEKEIKEELIVEAGDKIILDGVNLNIEEAETPCDKPPTREARRQPHSLV